MDRVINKERGLEIILDLAEAGLDIQSLTEKHGVDREDLARWVLAGETQRTLAGLCMLADYQTQMVLSHHRMTALTRLVEMVQSHRVAGEGEKTGDVDADLVRKACVDLLRLNMSRIEPPATAIERDENQEETPGEVLRKLMYGETPAENS